MAATTAALAACRICAPRFAETATAHRPRPIFQGRATARILIASQAPGARAHASGLPFDDPSGDRLRCWMGIGREIFYDPARIAIVPMAHCFPGYSQKGADLPPPKICAEQWRARMLAALPSVELTLSIGMYAQAWHLGRDRGRTLTDTVRAWRRHLNRGILPMPHPSWRNNAWLAANPWFEEEVLPWLRTAIGARL
ncbi:MAG: uracil-DNA glycosylase family protein [Pikeienuella sp.]